MTPRLRAALVLAALVGGLVLAPPAPAVETIKPASTAAVATDPAVVVTLSPNSPLPIGANPIGAVGQADTTLFGTSPGWLVSAIQFLTTFNTKQTSAAATAQTITIPGAVNARVVLRAVVCYLSAAGSATLTVSDGATVILDLGAFTGVNTAPFIPNLGSVGVASSIGNALTVNVGAAGAGVTTTCSVIADRR